MGNLFLSTVLFRFKNNSILRYSTVFSDFLRAGATAGQLILEVTFFKFFIYFPDPNVYFV